MLIGTYRTAELIASGHPLKALQRQLLAKQQCEELPLEYLSEEAVARCLFDFPTIDFRRSLRVTTWPSPIALKGGCYSSKRQPGRFLHAVHGSYSRKML
jgi:hypothetical protein